MTRRLCLFQVSRECRELWTLYLLLLILSVSYSPTVAAADGTGAQNVVRLNRYNFEDNVKNGKWFVKFFAPWCTHCQKIAPIWEKLADVATNKEWPAKIAEVDCTSNKDICERYNVKGYPTLLWISGSTRVRYTDDAKLADFAKFVMTQIGIAEKATAKSTEEASKQEGAERKHGSGHDVVVQPLQRLRALLSNWPTKSMVANLYIFSFLCLSAFVFLACAAFKEAEDEDRRKFEAELKDIKQD